MLVIEGEVVEDVVVEEAIVIRKVGVLAINEMNIENQIL